MEFYRKICWRETFMALGLMSILLVLLKTKIPNNHEAAQNIEVSFHNDTTSDILLSRQASSYQSWDDAIYYGNWLICLMNAPLETLTEWQSKWTVSATRTLDLYGWERTRRTVSSQDSFDSMALNTAMEDLGISTLFSKWQTVTDHHWHSRPPYKATGARYNNWFNVDDGAIVAKDNYSPDWFAKRKGMSKESVPPLKQWSDLVYLDWASMTTAGPQRRKVEHVFRYNIANPDTHRMLRLAMGNGDAGAAPALTEWPGISWTIDDAPGQAAFSNANSYGVAYFLLTHKAPSQLGLRIVDRIHVFNCPAIAGAEMWCMYFHIREGPIEKDGS